MGQRKRKDEKTGKTKYAIKAVHWEGKMWV